MNVLVVDNSGVIRSIIARTLRSMGVKRITHAANGAAAWAEFIERDIDLVITDWHMPYVDGIELTQQIRAVDSHIPIVMVTIVNAKHKVIEAMRAGVNDYLCKPFERAELQAKLDRYIPLLPLRPARHALFR